MYPVLYLAPYSVASVSSGASHGLDDASAYLSRDAQPRRRRIEIVVDHEELPTAARLVSISVSILHVVAAVRIDHRGACVLPIFWLIRFLSFGSVMNLKYMF